LTGLLVVITVASLGVTTLRYRVPRLVKAPEQRLDTKVAATSPVTHRRLRWLASGAFGGRYFLDVGKLAHLGHHFPEDRNFLWGRTLVRLPVSEGGESLSLDRYLAIHVFHEPSNSIPPGFAGELYINFGWVGLVLGLLGLGALHRLVFNYLAPRQHSWLVVGCLLVVIPASTLVLFNSSLAAAGLRGVIDVAVVVAICVSPTRLGRWLWPNRRRA